LDEDRAKAIEYLFEAEAKGDVKGRDKAKSNLSKLDDAIKAIDLRVSA
jgi:hypothetical protein